MNTAPKSSSNEADSSGDPSNRHALSGKSANSNFNQDNVGAPSVIMNSSSIKSGDTPLIEPVIVTNNPNDNHHTTINVTDSIEMDPSILNKMQLQIPSILN